VVNFCTAIVALLCSTPFGITEFRGVSVQVLPNRITICAQRLSASRGFAERAASAAVQQVWPRAQRLSASRSFAAGRAPRAARPPRGAQRLSASRSFAVDGVFLFHMTLHVLNAFRHHGVSRTQAKLAISDGGACAQRLSASRSFAEFADQGVVKYFEMCSTPFGITEFRGQQCVDFLQVSPGAQRLSASRSFAGQPGRHLSIDGLVLNAFRHHGVSRGVNAPPSKVFV